MKSIYFNYNRAKNHKTQIEQVEKDFESEADKQRAELNKRKKRTRKIWITSVKRMEKQKK